MTTFQKPTMADIAERFAQLQANQDLTERDEQMIAAGIVVAMGDDAPPAVGICLMAGRPISTLFDKENA